MLFCRLLIFFKLNFFKKNSEIPSVAISFDSDQARYFVGPDIGSNCLQRLSADGTGRQIVNQTVLLYSTRKPELILNAVEFTILTICLLGIFSCFCCHLLTFFKIIFFQKIFQGTIIVSNGLDPDLGPN